MAAMTLRRRVGMLSVAAVTAIGLTACGKSGSGNSALGDAPATSGLAGGSSPNTSPSPGANASPTNGNGGSGGGGGATATQSPLYPKDAKTYGLEILKAIANKDNGRLVSLSNLNAANYAQQQNYASKNGQWTNSDCTSGSTPACSYYNQTGDIAVVNLDASKLGSQGAGSSVSIEGSNYPQGPANYIGSFVYDWSYGPYVRMVSLSSNAIADHFKALPSYGSVGASGAGGTPYPCAHTAGKTCVDVIQQGGTATMPVQHFIVDMTRITAGKPNGIIGYEPAG